MGRSRETFHKKEVRKKKEKKKKEKEQRRLARKENQAKGGTDDMIAYVDEHGMITSTPPDPDKKEKIKAEDIEVSIPKDDSPELDPIRQGKVSYYNDAKGFGFIIDSETQDRVFVHVKELIDEIQEGDTVTFEVEKGLKGPAAVRVSRIK
jgi:cold shock CspA family protein